MNTLMGIFMRFDPLLSFTYILLSFSSLDILIRTIAYSGPAFHYIYSLWFDYRPTSKWNYESFISDRKD
jgi:hypothetical protein